MITIHKWKIIFKIIILTLDAVYLYFDLISNISSFRDAGTTMLTDCKMGNTKMREK